MDCLQLLTSLATSLATTPKKERKKIEVSVTMVTS